MDARTLRRSNARTLSVVAALAVAAALAATPASAQFARTYVGKDPAGNDLNACTLAAPCRSFARAIQQTLPDGEIVVLDSAGYGAVEITKSVSIVAPDGIYAGVSVFNASPPAPTPPGPNVGVMINASNLRVVLRNLQINGQGGNVGVQVATGVGGTELHLEKVTIANMAQYGVQLASPAKLSVKDSFIRDNTADGIRISTGAGFSDITIDNTRFERNASHVNFFGGAAVAITRSFFTGHTLPAIWPVLSGQIATVSIQDCEIVGGTSSGVAASGALINVAIRGSLISRNTTGVSIGTNATVVLDGNTISHNTTGVTVSGGVGRSIGNNAIRANTTDVSGTLTPLAPI